MANQPYSALAEIYEKVLSGSDYEAWADYLIGILNAYSSGKTGVDMACGSGYFTRKMAKSGYEVEGVDVSVDMLNFAVAIARKEGLNVLFRQGDMTSVKTFSKVDFITVINDGVNYLPQEKLEKTFKHFYSILKKDGLLVFDISTEYKLKNVIGNNIFSEDEEDLTYVWFNDFCGDKVEMDISVFLRRGDVYVKKEERQTQYVHTLESITDALQKAGYRSIIKQNHLGGDVANDSLRVTFIVKK